MSDEQKAMSAAQELYRGIFKALKEFDDAVPTKLGWAGLGPGYHRLEAFKVTNESCRWKGYEKLETYPGTPGGPGVQSAREEVIDASE